MIKILGVCKREFFLTIIGSHLKLSGIEVVAQTNKIDNAVDIFSKSNADIIVLDANWYDCELSGEGVLSNLLDYDNNCKVIITTTFYQPKIEEQFLTLGAKGYFYKNIASLDSMVSCIIAVYNCAKV